MTHHHKDGGVVDVRGQLIPYIKMKGLLPYTIPICLIDCLTSGVDEGGVRYNLADTKYPIIVYLEGGRYSLVDGRHRIVKTLARGEQHINAYVLRKEEVGLFRK